MPHTETFDASPASEILQNAIAFEKAAAIEQIRSQGSVNIMTRIIKPGVCHIGIIVDERGRSLPLVNAVSSGRITLQDAARFAQYPDIIISPKNYNLKTILKKFSEYLFLNFQIQDITVNAYSGVKSFKDQQPVAVLDPKVGKLLIAA